jgi:hypothetical protein
MARVKIVICVDIEYFEKQVSDFCLNKRVDDIKYQYDDGRHIAMIIY